MQKMMISCEEAGILANKGDVDKLSFSEKFNLQLHLAGCKACRMAQKHIKLISDCFRYGAAKIEQGTYEKHLTETFRAELQELIDTKRLKL